MCMLAQAVRRENGRLQPRRVLTVQQSPEEFDAMLPMLTVCDEPLAVGYVSHSRRA